MNLEKIIMAIGARSRIGLASIFSIEKEEELIMKFWEAGIGYVITKTMMDYDYRAGEKPKVKIKWEDDEKTLYHTGTTCSESPDFYHKHGVIGRVLNGFISEGVAVIPSIGSKNIDADAWVNMQRYLPDQHTPIIEINFRYTYRSLVQKYKNEILGNKLVNCDEYLNDYLNSIPNLNQAEKRNIKNRANSDFKVLFSAIRDIFPPDRYCLIAKLWPSPELETHLGYTSEKYFDSVTLVNSIKAEPPVPFKKIPKEKIPQMSGLRLREYRDYALRTAMRMNYLLPIFASGGVAVEAKDSLKGSVEDGIRDIANCFALGADYVQLGVVAYGGGPKAVAAVMKALGARYRLDKSQGLVKAA